MKYLIDTHIFLWLLFDPAKIPAKKLKLLKDQSNDIRIASIAFWEISLKYALGKLSLTNITPEALPKLAETMGIKISEIGAKEMANSHALPKIEGHKDPFDRLLVWFCIDNGYTLVSMDGKFNGYKKHHLKLL